MATEPKPLKSNPRTYRSNTANGYQTRLHIKTLTMDRKKNQTVLSWVFEVAAGDKYTYNAHHTAEVTVGGAIRYQVYNKWFNGPAKLKTSKVIASGTILVQHNKFGEAGVTLASNLRTNQQDKTNYPWIVPPLECEGLYSVEKIILLPEKALPPTVSENLSTRKLIVGVPVVETNFHPTTGYQVRIKDDKKRDEWVVYNCITNTRQYEFTPDSPVTSFEFQGRAKTFAGWGEWSDSKEFVSTGMGPKVKSGSTWRDTNTYLYIDNRWVAVLPYVKSGGVWRTVGR